MPNVEVLPECPFYDGEFKRAIRCEGITEESFLKLCFPDEKTLRVFKLSKCYSMEWERCPIARMLNGTYGC